MKNILKIELKRSLISKYILLLILLGLAIHLYSLFSWDGDLIFFDYHATDLNKNAVNNFLYFNINKYIFWYHGMDTYVVINPLLPCIPYAVSLMVDKKTAFYDYIVTRVRKKYYLIAKIIANSIAGGIVTATPTLIFYSILSITTRNLVYKFIVFPLGFMHNLFMTNPDKYIIIFILIEFLFGAVYANFAMAISCFTNNKIVITITPFVYWYVGTFIFERVRFLKYLSPAMFNAFLDRGDSSGFVILFQAVVMFTVSIVVIFHKAKDGSKNEYCKI